MGEKVRNALEEKFVSKQNSECIRPSHLHAKPPGVGKTSVDNIVADCALVPAHGVSTVVPSSDFDLANPSLRVAACGTGEPSSLETARVAVQSVKFDGTASAEDTLRNALASASVNRGVLMHGELPQHRVDLLSADRITNAGAPAFVGEFASHHSGMAREHCLQDRY